MKGFKKDLLIIFALVLLVAVLILGTDIQSVDEYYLTHIDDIGPDSETVTLSIRCDTVLANLDKLDPALREGDYIPEDGIIFPETELVLRDGDTVFDILSRATRYYRIQMEYQGADETALGTAYVEGLGNLYQFSCGEGSGWIFFVNGKRPSEGASHCQLIDGDRIEWLYTCEFGADLPDHYQGVVK